jgi:COMPASS component SWD3
LPPPHPPHPPPPTSPFPSISPIAQGKAACKPLRGHNNYVFCVHFNPRANVLASGSFDESARIWDVRTGSCFRALPAHSEPVTSVQFHNDGSFLATGSYDGLVRLWDPSLGQCLKTIQEEGVPPVACLRFSPGGKHILTASLDGKLRLWDYVASKRLRTYEGHANHLIAASAGFVVTGGRQAVICGSEDGQPFLWDVRSRQVMQALPAQGQGPVIALDAHPTADALVTATGADGPATVTVWSDPSGGNGLGAA